MVELVFDLGDVFFGVRPEIVVNLQVDTQVPPGDLSDLRADLFPVLEVTEVAEELVNSKLLAGDDVEDVEILGDSVLAVADEGLLVQLWNEEIVS